MEEANDLDRPSTKVDASASVGGEDGLRPLLGRDGRSNSAAADTAHRRCRFRRSYPGRAALSCPTTRDGRLHGKAAIRGALLESQSVIASAAPEASRFRTGLCGGLFGVNGPSFVPGVSPAAIAWVLTCCFVLLLPALRGPLLGLVLPQCCINLARGAVRRRLGGSGVGGMTPERGARGLVDAGSHGSGRCCSGGGEGDCEGGGGGHTGLQSFAVSAAGTVGGAVLGSTAPAARSAVGGSPAREEAKDLERPSTPLNSSAWAAGQDGLRPLQGRDSRSNSAAADTAARRSRFHRPWPGRAALSCAHARGRADRR